MRALIQRVSSASVTVDGAAVGEIARGLVVLVGVGRADTADDVAWTVNKVLGARLFEGPDGRAWGASARSLALPLLVISQFTLHASLKSPKPDWKGAAGADAARGLFDALLAALRAEHGAARVQTGVFGAMMSVALVNEGPCTVALDSKNRAFAGFDEAGGAGEGGQGGGGAAAAASEE